MRNGVADPMLHRCVAHQVDLIRHTPAALQRWCVLCYLKFQVATVTQHTKEDGKLMLLSPEGAPEP